MCGVPMCRTGGEGIGGGTLCPNRLRHGAGVAQALGVDRSDHEEVDGVGPETLHRELGGLHVVRHRLPAVAHRLAAMTM